ncbi:uncharacterized protein ACRADG_004414 [Cochliomyia hominivorax]
MYGKFIILSLSLAFVSLQFAQAIGTTPLTPRPTDQNITKCYTCETPSSCLLARPLTCNQQLANATHSALALHFQNVQDVINTQFECLKISYSSNNKTVIDVRGCINTGVNPCALHPKNSTLKSKLCKNCKGNLCNPADSVSSSLPLIMLSSIFALMLLLKNNAF